MEIDENMPTLILLQIDVYFFLLINYYKLLVNTSIAQHVLR